MKIFSASVLKHRYLGTQKSCFEFLDFYLSENETVLVSGPSGAGKTTLFRLIENSISRSECVIEKDCSSVLVYQDLRLTLERTVLENILAGAYKENSPYSLQFSQAQTDKAKSLLEKVHLLDHQNKLVSELSGGQKQRVAVIRALMCSPQVVIADECFSQLDQKNALEVFSLMKSLQEEYKFCLVISQHSAVISESLFDRKIEIPAGAMKLELRESKKSRFMLFWLGVLALVVWSTLSLDLAGFNSDQSFQNAADILYRMMSFNGPLILGFDWLHVAKLFLATLKMALLGSFFGLLISLPLAVLAADNISSSLVRRPIRFFLMVVRTVPSLVWALVFVAAFGIGSVAGTLALSLYSVGYLGKLIYESLEDLDQKSFASVRQLGASGFQAFVSSLLPQARPVLVAHFIFMLEYNIRAASILGLVGAGGIGQELLAHLEWRRFSEAGLILFMMVILIYLTDRLSRLIRKSLLLERGE